MTLHIFCVLLACKLCKLADSLVCVLLACKLCKLAGSLVYERLLHQQELKLAMEPRFDQITTWHHSQTQALPPSGGSWAHCW